MAIIPRRIEAPLLEALKRHPVVLLEGLRGTGKSTLLTHRLTKNRGYVSLADPAVREAARESPHRFLSAFKQPTNLDQIELVPELIQTAASMLRDEAAIPPAGSLLLGRTLGPAQPPRPAGIPGFQLWSLAVSEIPRADREQDGGIVEYLTAVFRGGLPALLEVPTSRATPLLRRYIDDLCVRDLDVHLQKRYRGKSYLFLQLVAALSGGTPNVARWARDLHLAPNTVRSWFQYLQGLGLCHETVAFPENLGPRTSRSPRFYLADSGLLGALAGLQSPGQAQTQPIRYQMLTTFVCGELARLAAHEGEIPQIYHWQASAGEVVDFVFESEGRLHAVVCAVGEEPNQKQMKALARFLSLLAPDRRGHALAICLRDTPKAIGRVQLIPVMRLRDF